MRVLKKLAQHVLEKEGVDKKAQLSVALVKKEVIKSLNFQYRGEDSPTDVLAFAFDEGDDEEFYLGEVVISPEVARAQAGDYGLNFSDEMKLLLAHGVLHLLGYEHEIPAQAQKMQLKEKELLESFSEEGKE